MSSLLNLFAPRTKDRNAAQTTVADRPQASCMVLPLEALLVDTFGTRISISREPQENRIPQKVYQTWPSKRLPPRLRESTELLRRQNPDMSFAAISDDADCRAFLEKEYADEPEILAAYDALVPGVCRTDLWSYCVLYKYGGIYLDPHFVCTPGTRLSEVFLGDREEYFVYRSPQIGGGKEDPPCFLRGCMASAAGNRVLRAAMDRILANVRERVYPEEGGPSAVTGGALLFAAYKDVYPDSFQEDETPGLCCEESRSYLGGGGVVKEGCSLLFEKCISLHFASGNLDSVSRPRQQGSDKKWIFLASTPFYDLAKDVLDHNMNLLSLWAQKGIYRDIL